MVMFDRRIYNKYSMFISSVARIELCWDQCRECELELVRSDRYECVCLMWCEVMRSVCVNRNVLVHCSNVLGVNESSCLCGLCAYQSVVP